VSHAGAMDSEVPDPEVPERATRPHSYSAQYTPEILAGYETLDRQGKGTSCTVRLYTSLEGA
jgi:transposase